MKLLVKHDKYPENQILINGIECTWCGTNSFPDENYAYGDIDVCQACYENCIE